MSRGVAVATGLSIPCLPIPCPSIPCLPIPCLPIPCLSIPWTSLRSGISWATSERGKEGILGLDPALAGGATRAGLGLEAGAGQCVGAGARAGMGMGAGPSVTLGCRGRGADFDGDDGLAAETGLSAAL